MASSTSWITAGPSSVPTMAQTGPAGRCIRLSIGAHATAQVIASKNGDGLRPPRQARIAHLEFSEEDECPRTCRPASMSRKSTAGRARSRASAPPSPPSWARRGRAVQRADARHQLEPVHQQSSATSSRAPTSPTPCTATSRTAAGPATSFASAANGDAPGARPSGRAGRRRRRLRQRLPGPGARAAAAPATTSAWRSPTPRRSKAPRATPEDAFKLTVKRGNRVEETFDNLTTKRGKQNVVTVVNAQSKLIRLEEVGTRRAGAGGPHQP